MTVALPYSAKRSLGIWFCLIASILLHCAAVAVAEMDHDVKPAAAPDPGDRDDFPPIDVEPMPEDTPPPELPDVAPPPPPSAEQSFPEEASIPPPPRSERAITPPVPRHRGSQPGATNPAATKAFALIAPRPEYPYEARRSRITGTGLALLTIDPQNGNVLSVSMATSTGSTVLDQATITGFRRWRFKPGTASVVRCPITYTLTGAAY